MFKRIVVALNQSTCATHAFDLARDLAKVEGATIEICTVVDPRATLWRSAHAHLEHAVSQAEAAADQIVTDAVQSAREAGLTAAGRVLSGDPAAAIVAFAAEMHADAIVMGTHGWSGIKHLVMGSVAESVVRSAPCPVLVVRGDAVISRVGERVAAPA